MTTEEMITVLNAIHSGTPVEFTERGLHGWRDSSSPIPDFCRYDYRIKPVERRSREWWVKESVVSRKNSVYVYPKPCDPHELKRGGWIHVREVLE